LISPKVDGRLKHGGHFQGHAPWQFPA